MTPASDDTTAPLVLAIETATRSSIVAVGRTPGTALVSRREARQRHGADLLSQVEEALSGSAVTRRAIDLVAVGAGPGSFTGLRVGLATAKTLAYTLSIPIVAVTSTDALRRAAVETASAAPDAAVVLPAGAHDHYLALPGQAPVLIAPGRLRHELGEHPAIGVDVGPELLGTHAAHLGEAAVAGLPGALLAMALERHEAGRTDDAATLVPTYVALPRGLSHSAEELGWSPDLR